MATVKDIGRLNTDKAGGPGVKLKIAELTFSTSYTTGGEAVAPADLGLSEILLVDAAASPIGGVVVYNYATNKLQLYFTGSGNGVTLTEASNASNQSTHTVRALVLGR